ncbi:MAG: RNA-directed DNA polymerase [Deltaproteobacteria bacterium]|nr:RNA-directed DNA polymerase [Deltaproteobacteria bacterium]
MPDPYSKKTLAIRTLKHLVFRLHSSVDELQKVAAEAEVSYSFWQKKKKNGKLRQISAPNPRLKRIQVSIHNLLKEIELPSCVHCGVKGRSNLTNAKMHAGHEWVLSLDFKEFFPSISHHLVYHTFRHELDCSPPVASILTRLSTLLAQVPQGGPMSTDIANLVCRRLDRRLLGLADRYGLKYTRYCDDLCFSGYCVPDSFKGTLKEIVGQCSFSLNPDKESLCGKHQPQIVTGLTVNHKRLCVPRKTRRAWRKDRHLFFKYEAEQLPEKIRSKQEQRHEGRHAYLVYVNQVH